MNPKAYFKMLFQELLLHHNVEGSGVTVLE